MLRTVTSESPRKERILGNITSMVTHRKMVIITFKDANFAHNFVCKALVQFLLEGKPITNTDTAKRFLVPVMGHRKTDKGVFLWLPKEIGNKRVTIKVTLDGVTETLMPHRQKAA